MMYAVRINKDGDGYVFKSHPCEGRLEMVTLDSTPGIVATVDANNAAHACQRAWYLAEHMYDDQPELDGSPSLRC